jgi:hypothetical protein
MIWTKTEGTDQPTQRTKSSPTAEVNGNYGTNLLEECSIPTSNNYVNLITHLHSKLDKPLL